jgi:hypothetical protein
MASNLSPAIAASKASNSSKAGSASGQLSPASSQTSSTPVSNQYPQQRGAGGVHGQSRASSTPRNNQQQRKQNKSSKRYARLADEDAIAESVCFDLPFDTVLCTGAVTSSIY